MNLNTGKYWDKAWVLRFKKSFLPSSFAITIGFIVYFGMAISTYSYAVVYIITQFLILMPLLNMMGFQVTALIISTFLTSKIISFKCFNPPLMIIRIISQYMVLRANTSFPIREVYGRY